MWKIQMVLKRKLRLLQVLYKGKSRTEPLSLISIRESVVLSCQKPSHPHTVIYGRCTNWEDRSRTEDGRIWGNDRALSDLCCRVWLHKEEHSPPRHSQISVVLEGVSDIGDRGRRKPPIFRVKYGSSREDYISSRGCVNGSSTQRAMSA